jgi:hypothetical protein
MHTDLEQPGALARLLRALPNEAARPYGWSEFQRRTQQRASNRRSVAGGQALAALAVIAVGLVALGIRFSASPAPPRPPEAPAATSGSADGGAERQARPTPAARTQALERWLASLPDDPPLMRVGSRAAVTGLEDRIAQVDDLLTAEGVEPAQPARLLALQQERVRLVGALAQVRYAETLADASAD